VSIDVAGNLKNLTIENWPSHWPGKVFAVATTADPNEFIIALDSTLMWVERKGDSLSPLPNRNLVPLSNHATQANFMVWDGKSIVYGTARNFDYGHSRFFAANMDTGDVNWFGLDEGVVPFVCFSRYVK